jgi:hypothetical protein
MGFLPPPGARFRARSIFGLLIVQYVCIRSRIASIGQVVFLIMIVFLINQKAPTARAKNLRGETDGQAF